ARPLPDRVHPSRSRAGLRDRRPPTLPSALRRGHCRARLPLRSRRQGSRNGDARSRGDVSVAVRGAPRLERAFTRARAERRLAIVVYLTVGYHGRASTGAVLRAALDGGAGVLKLGVLLSG